MAQVERTIDIFEAKTNGLAQGLFIFDNASGHMKRALDAITAKGMAKGASQFYLFLCVLTLCLPSSQVWLDAYTERATHPRWHQPSYRHATVVLFPRRPPPLLRLV
jgi:hypothetical protein